jgi:hypothetical protein
MSAAAIYARYSSDLQREASIEGQLPSNSDQEPSAASGRQ